MPVETTELNQQAVLWSNTGIDNYGEVTVAAAVEINTRWIEDHREANDEEGNTIAINATVIVEQDIIVGSILWLGALEDVADPPVNLKQVVSFKKTPDVKGREYRRSVSVIKYSNTLPSLT